VIETDSFTPTTTQYESELSIAMSVIYIDLAILRKNAGDCRQFGKYTGHREPIKHSSTPGCETQFKQLILNKFQALDNKPSTIHGYSSHVGTKKIEQSLNDSVNKETQEKQRFEEDQNRIQKFEERIS